MQASEAVEAVLSPGRGEHVTLVKAYHVLHVNTEEVKKKKKTERKRKMRHGFLLLLRPLLIVYCRQQWLGIGILLWHSKPEREIKPLPNCQCVTPERSLFQALLTCCRNAAKTGKTHNEPTLGSFSECKS